MLSKRKLFSISMIFFPLLSLVSCYIEEENPQEKNFTLDDLTKKYNIKDGELNFGKSLKITFTDLSFLEKNNNGYTNDNENIIDSFVFANFTKRNEDDSYTYGDLLATNFSTAEHIDNLIQHIKNDLYSSVYTDYEYYTIKENNERDIKDSYIAYEMLSTENGLCGICKFLAKTYRYKYNTIDNENYDDAVVTSTLVTPKNNYRTNNIKTIYSASDLERVINSTSIPKNIDGKVEGRVFTSPGNEFYYEYNAIKNSPLITLVLIDKWNIGTNFEYVNSNGNSGVDVEYAKSSTVQLSHCAFFSRKTIDYDINADFLISILEQGNSPFDFSLYNFNINRSYRVSY